MNPFNIQKIFPYYYGWLVLFVTGLAMFFSGPGQTYSISIFLEPMRKSLDLSLSEIASLYTLGSLSAAFFMIFIGKSFDKLGGQILMPLIAVLLSISCIWMSHVSSSFELYIGFTLLRSLGQGALFLVSSSLIAVWFVKYRGRASAFNSLGSSISQAVYPNLIFILIINNSWEESWRFLAIIILLGLLIPSLLILRRSPESIGLFPDGSIYSKNNVDHTQNYIVDEVNWTLIDAMKTKTFWFLLFANTSNPLIMTALTFIQVPLFDNRGLDSSLAAKAFFAVSPMMLIGSFSSGFLIEKFPARFLIAFNQIIAIIGMFFIFLISNTWEGFFYAGILGFSMGFSQIVNPVIWANYYGRKSIGSIKGFVTTIVVGSAAIGPFPLAWLVDHTGSYEKSISLFMILPILCIISAIMAKPPVKFSSN
ncbi:MAG: hypothetical protein CL758_00170 [Chloroflexi bacterium]|nr:hypothetical protein [Chloroflexota bacterium]|tara:strand:- start:89 stop:1354 length:1266 start_codon:yes stop_codon:yes gene_type:complete